MASNGIKFQDGTLLSIDKLNDKEFQYVSFTLKEKLLGELPDATLRIRCNEDLIADLDQVKVKIVSPSGNQVEGDMFVYEKTYNLGEATIKLLGGTPDFVRKSNINKFSNIKNAVSSLYPGDVVKNTDTDLMNDMEIFQTNQSDYSLLLKLLPGWKKDTIYGFSLAGLVLLDLNNYQPIDDKVYANMVNLNMVNPASITKPRVYDFKTEFIDYTKDSDTKDKNHIYVKFGNALIPVNSEYKDFIGNVLNNSKFDTTIASENYTTREYTTLGVGDCLTIQDTDKNLTDLFIFSKVTEILMNEINVSYCFKSIKEQ